MADSQLTEVFSPIRWQGDALELLDQTVLPRRQEWLRCDQPQQVADAIYRLSVRGAPAIGVSAAFGLVLGIDPESSADELKGQFVETRDLLAATRPTAVNLVWALRRGQEVFDRVVGSGADASTVRAALEQWAIAEHRADIEANRRMGEAGATLFERGDRVLTHCNAGALATAGVGTALGVIDASFRAGKVETVWVDETRPLLQGARLTAWELGRLGIPYHVIPDGAAGSLLSRSMVDRIVVGADRIAANGDVANKIGTYTVAVLAERHGVPFYVAAPLSTIDLETPNGEAIPIEERSPDEVTRVFGTQVTPDDAPALNIAFDVTPAELVAGIITEVGVLSPPYGDSISRAFER
ncbi:MAG: S-methyl-5-thioribose-1-phosphate isomerase [Acidobacteriota bacterium]|nr:S-methyl-5-thioribose-1-phosphate isomerase [Acidobacteriota bacterium]